MFIVIDRHTKLLKKSIFWGWWVGGGGGVEIRMIVYPNERNIGTIVL